MLLNHFVASHHNNYFDPKTSNEQARGGAITSYNQPLDVSGDPCHQETKLKI